MRKDFRRDAPGRLPRRAFTLAEVLVSITIVGILAAALTAVFAPAAKRSAIETRIRTDLRGIAGSINIYMGDNDGGYPLGSRSLPSVKWQVPEMDSPHGESGYGPFQGRAFYYYTFPFRFQQLERVYNFPVKFDPAVEPIVITSFFPKRFGQYRYEYYWVGTQRNPSQVRTEDWRHLGVRLDGSMRWEIPTTWQLMAAGHALLPLPTDKPRRRRK